MRLVSVRRAVPVGIATAVALALGAPGVASAKTSPPEPDVLPLCTGAQHIEGEGSTFQGPVQFIWTGVNSEKGNELTGTGFNHSTSSLSCPEGHAGKEPKAYYNQKGNLQRGSGSCLKTWGNKIKTFGEKLKSGTEEDAFPRVKEFPFCGTDEAPSEAVKEEFEAPEFMATDPEAGKGEEIESIPVAQGAETVIVHLPADCTAKSEIETSKKKKEKLGRLALDQEVVEGVYEGTIKTWGALVAAQGSDGKDELTCTGSGLTDTITPVVRADKSGTTHIFKEFLAQVRPGQWEAEEFNEVNGGADKGEKPCSSGNLGAGAKESWESTGEGCENQRWPKAAHVVFASETGNPGVIKEVNAKESSIGYADLAVAREKGFFSKKGLGGENKKEEKNKEFWAVVQNSEPGTSPVTFADPATKGDKEAVANSNCKSSVYVATKGEEFPPANTRLDWSKVKAENVSKTYVICGITYDLAARKYWYFLQKYGLSKTESQEVATTVHDYLQWVVNTKTGGGGKLIKDSDYEALPKEVQKRAEFGAEEIGNEKA